MIKIITDSTSDIDLTYAQELDIDIVPLKVIINGKEYNLISYYFFQINVC